MNTYDVRARRWRGGWELHIDGEGVTQCRTLEQAAQQVLDYLATVHDDFDSDDAHIEVHYDLGGIEDEVDEVKDETTKAAESQRDAAQHLRQLTASLREMGLSVTDMATVLGVSRGRISQLTPSSGRRRQANRSRSHRVVA